MILQRYTVFDEIADFEPDSGSFAVHSRAATLQQGEIRVAGHFDYIGEKCILLFRLGGVLYVQLDQQRLTMADHFVEVRAEAAHRVLRISGDHVILEIEYDPPIIDPPLVDDLTPFVEEEHFDFGLFITSVSHDHSRQERLYTK